MSLFLTESQTECCENVVLSRNTHAVQTINQGFRKAFEGSHYTHLMLLSYQNTPLAGFPYSPAQPLMRRRLTDQSPCRDQVLQPQVLADAQRLLLQRQKQVKHFYD